MSRWEVPRLVRERAESSGAVGRQWLAVLPERLVALSKRWQLVLGEPFVGGTASFVVGAHDSSGRQCVLKVAMTLDATEETAFERSVRAHQLTDGRGCARLLAYDPSAPAVLLERLGPNLAELGLALPNLLDVIATTLRSYWRPVPGGEGLRTGAEQARYLGGFIATSWDELGHPCERAVIDRALAYCDRRAAAFDPRRAVLVHGDAHGWNTLDAGDGTYKFVDPEGLWSEPEHDLGVPMREYNEPLLDGDTARLVRQRAEFLARSCGLDAERVWEWGFIERVSTGLANLRAFDNDDGLLFLEVARRSSSER